MKWYHIWFWSRRLRFDSPRDRQVMTAKVNNYSNLKEMIDRIFKDIERTLQDIRNNLNNEYPKFLKAVYSTRLTQQEKKEKTIEFICLLEELANTIKDR